MLITWFPTSSDAASSFPTAKNLFEEFYIGASSVNESFLLCHEKNMETVKIKCWNKGWLFMGLFEKHLYLFWWFRSRLESLTSSQDMRWSSKAMVCSSEREEHVDDSASDALSSEHAVPKPWTHSKGNTIPLFFLTLW